MEELRGVEKQETIVIINYGRKESILSKNEKEKAMQTAFPAPHPSPLFPGSQFKGVQKLQITALCQPRRVWDFHPLSVERSFSSETESRPPHHIP